MVHCDCFLRQSETSCVPKVQQSMNTLKRIAKKRDQRFRSGSNIVSDGQPLISSQLLPITLNLAPRVSGRAARGARFRWSAPVAFVAPEKILGVSGLYFELVLSLGEPKLFRE